MNTNSWRSRLWTAVRLVFGVGLLVLAVRDVDLAQLLASLGELDPGWFAFVLATILLTQGLKAARWYLLLRPVVRGVSPLMTLGVLLVGQAGNILLPLRGGDLVRSWLGSGEDPERVPAVATGLVVEKGLDALFLAGAIALGVPLLPVGANLAVASVDALAIGVGLLGLAGVLFVLQPAFWPRVRKWLMPLPYSHKIVSVGDRFVTGLRSLRRAQIFRGVLLLTVLSWAAMYATNQGLVQAMNFSAPLSAGLVVMVLVLVGIIPGLMPGQVGPFYFFARLALEQYGIPAQASAAYGVVLHALYLLPPLIGAAIYFMTRAVGQQGR